MFCKEVYRGLARYIGEDELYYRIDVFPPFQFYKNEVYYVRIIDEGYLFYVFVLTPDEEPVTYAMGNCIVMEDTNGNRKLLKKRYDAKIDAVAAMMDAFVAYKINREAFE